MTQRFIPRFKYAQLSTKEGVDCESDSFIGRYDPHRWRTVAISNLFTCLLTATLLLFFFQYIDYLPSSLETCTRLLSVNSPAFEAIKVLPETYFPNSTAALQSPYIGASSQEVDQKWEAIGRNIPGLRLFDEDIRSLKKSDIPGQPLHRIPKELGGGYFAWLEVFHLLHCLNSFRQAMFYNWDYYKNNYNNVPQSSHHEHLDHCIDAMRVHLMCYADVTPVTFYDPADQPNRKWPLPDFGTLHTCRDFDAIVEWSKGNPRAVTFDQMGLASTFLSG